MSRQRADVLVVEQGLAESRNRAQALILAGAVLYDDGNEVAEVGVRVAEVLHRGRLQRRVRLGSGAG